MNNSPNNTVWRDYIFKMDEISSCVNICIYIRRSGLSIPFRIHPLNHVISANYFLLCYHLKSGDLNRRMIKFFLFFLYFSIEGTDLQAMSQELDTEIPYIKKWFFRPLDVSHPITWDIQGPTVYQKSDPFVFSGERCIIILCFATNVCDNRHTARPCPPVNTHSWMARHSLHVLHCGQYNKLNVKWNLTAIPHEANLLQNLNPRRGWSSSTGGGRCSGGTGRGRSRSSGGRGRGRGRRGTCRLWA